MFEKSAMTSKRPPTKEQSRPKGFGEIHNGVSLPSETNNVMNSLFGFDKDKRARMKANKQ